MNDQNNNLGNDRLNAIVIREASIIKNEAYNDMMNHKTISHFNDKNTVDSPSEPTDTLYFTNSLLLAKKFKKLNNKRSAGHDQIPNIVLKHITPICYNLTILFNNMLIIICTSHKNGRKQKLLQYQKKDKDQSLPSSYRPISLLPKPG